jgi:hypothetical protein
MDRVNFIVREGEIKVLLILGKIKLAYVVDTLEIDPFWYPSSLFKNLYIALIWQQHGSWKNTPDIARLIPFLGPAFYGSILYYGVVTH